MRSETTTSHNVGIVGFGTIGEGLARWLVRRGHHVFVKTSRPEKIEALVSSLRDPYQRKPAGTLVATPDDTRRLDLVHLVDAFDEFPAMDIIIESTKEDLASKRQVWSHITHGVDTRHTLLATTTSSISIGDIGRGLENRSSFVGLHFFNPLSVMDLVEVVPGKHTDTIWVTRAIQFCKDIGKIPIVVKDVPGFLVNRVFGRYLNEASRMLDGGAGSIQEIDLELSSRYMLNGPFYISDLVGLDVLCSINRNLNESYGPARGNRFRISRSLEMLCGKSRLGRKTGKGYYRYSHQGIEKGEDSDEELASLLDEVRRQSSIEHVPLDRELALLSMINEAFLCVEEGVVTKVADLDAALKYGVNMFKGPIEIACQIGLEGIYLRLKDMAREFGERFDPPPSVMRLESMV